MKVFFKWKYTWKFSYNAKLIIKHQLIIKKLQFTEKSFNPFHRYLTLKYIKIFIKLTTQLTDQKKYSTEKK